MKNTIWSFGEDGHNELHNIFLDIINNKKNI